MGDIKIIRISPAYRSGWDQIKWEKNNGKEKQDGDAQDAREDEGKGPDGGSDANEATHDWHEGYEHR